MAPPVNHPRAIRAAHWATVALLVAAYALAWSLDSAPSKEESAWRLMLHRSVGVTILLLTLVRIVIRSRAVLPDWPDDLPNWQRLAAKASEWCLYAALLVQPLLGIAGSLLRGTVVLFGVPVPALVAPDRPLAHAILAVHGVVAICLLALIGLHIAAALQHHFIRRDDVLARMLPVLRRRRGNKTAQRPV